MSNFSDFIKENKDDVNTNTKIEKQDNKKIEDMIDKYSKYSNDKLLSEFMKLTLEKKKNGTLTEGELNKLKSTLEPFLNLEQQSMLHKIIQMVKDA